MEAKRIAGVALLLFAAGSLVVLAGKEISKSGARSTVDPHEGQGNEDARTGRKVIAYYFYTNFRCSSCETIERLSRETIEENFKKELADRRLEFRVINVEEPGNEHFIQDFQLVSKSLVLVERTQGKETRYANLQRVWELLTKPDEFKRYVREEVAAFLKGDDA